MQKIMIFTGAGFGNSLGLPTTSEFKNVIDELSGPLKLALQHYLKDKFYDIEHLLSTLEMFCLQGNSLIKSMLASPPYASSNNEFGIFYNANIYMNNLQTEARAFLLQLKNSLFHILENYDKTLAVNLYEGLFEEIKTQFPESAISIFTTNYDLTFEYVQDDLDDFYKKHGIVDDLNDGFINRRKQNIYDPSQQYEWDKKVIEYKKLHGSLDWIKSTKGIIKTNAVIPPSSLANMLLIYPGFKGTPDGEPYKNLHDDLLSRLLTAHSVFVIGFAFRDEFINNQFETALKMNKDLFVYCYNPLEISELPQESKIGYFTKNYPDHFIYKKKAVNATDSNPLDLKV